MQSISYILETHNEIVPLLAGATYTKHAFGPYEIEGHRFKGRAGTISAFRLLSKDMKHGMDAVIVKSMKALAACLRLARGSSSGDTQRARVVLHQVIKKLFGINANVNNPEEYQLKNERSAVTRAVDSLLATCDRGRALVAGLDAVVLAGNVTFFMSMMRGVPQLTHPNISGGYRVEGIHKNIHAFSLFAGQLVYGNDASVTNCTVVLRKDMKPQQRENAGVYKIAREMLHLANVSPPYTGTPYSDGVSLAAATFHADIPKNARIALLKVPFFTDKLSSLQTLLNLSCVPMDQFNRKFALEAEHELKQEKVISELHLGMRMQHIDLAIASSDLCSSASLADVAAFWPNAAPAVKVAASMATGIDALGNGGVRRAIKAVTFFAGPVLRSYDRKYGRSCSPEALDFVSGACHLLGYPLFDAYRFDSFFTLTPLVCQDPAFADKVATALRAYELIGEVADGFVFDAHKRPGEEWVTSTLFNAIRTGPGFFMLERRIQSAVKKLAPEADSIPKKADFLCGLTGGEAKKSLKWKRATSRALYPNIKTRFAAFDVIGVCPKRFVDATNADMVDVQDELIRAVEAGYSSSLTSGG